MALGIEERINDPYATTKMAIGSSLAGLWTALPGIVQSFDAGAVTAKVQPAIKGIVTATDGTTSAVNLPLLLDCPVVFQRGGGATLTFPINAGDECLVVFSSRCIDAWWQSGGVQIPMEMRMHDLSDGFVFVGPMSQAKKIAGISTGTVQLRSDDGLAYIELDPSGHVVNVVAPGGMKITAPTVEITGNLTVDQSTTSKGVITGQGGMVVSGGSGASVTGDMIVSGTVTGSTDVVGGNKSLKGHTHTAQGATAVTTAPN